MTVIAAANRCTTQNGDKIEFSGNLLVSLAGFQALHALVESSKFSGYRCGRWYIDALMVARCGPSALDVELQDLGQGVELFVDGVEARVHRTELGVNGTDSGAKEILQHFPHVFDYAHLAIVNAAGKRADKGRDICIALLGELT